MLSTNKPPVAERGWIAAEREASAIAFGHKTQIRVLPRHQPHQPTDAGWEAGTWLLSCGAGKWTTNARLEQKLDPKSGKCVGEREYRVTPEQMLMDASPFKTGQQLYVRETWGPSDGGVIVKRIEDRAGMAKPKDGRWRSASTMPKWAARLRLGVDSVRAERLQCLTVDDAIAEGFDARYMVQGKPGSFLRGNKYGITVTDQFRGQWDVKHVWECWDKNPFVYVVSFSVLEGRMLA